MVRRKKKKKNTLCSSHPTAKCLASIRKYSTAVHHSWEFKRMKRESFQRAGTWGKPKARGKMRPLSKTLKE